MNLNWLKKIEITIPLPILGIGCGVLGLSLVKVTVNMGKYASKLLKSLEYRGYDSTGAVFQKDNMKVTLLKDVGAPSTLVKTLGMKSRKERYSAGRFAGLLLVP